LKRMRAIPLYRENFIFTVCLRNPSDFLDTGLFSKFLALRLKFVKAEGAKK